VSNLSAEKSNKTKQVDLLVSGMTCSSCVGTVEKSLNKLPGIRAVVNLAMETAHVIAPVEYSEDQLIKAVNTSGYSARVFKGERESFEKSNRLGIRLFLTFLLTAPIILISMFHNLHSKLDAQLLALIDNINLLLKESNQNFTLGYPLAPPSAWLSIILSIPIIFMLAWPIHRAALKNVLNPTMDTLVSLGSLITFVWSSYSAITFDANSNSSKYIYAEVSAAVIFFVMLGRYLEHKAKRKARSALAELFKLSSSHVEIIDNGNSKIIPITELEIGSTFIVKPGEKIATDGVVISGSSTVNNSFLTGEFKPVEVLVNSLVFAGAINNNGSLVVKATRVGADTELARITKMVLTAQTEKAPAQQLADKISKVFVPIVLALAVATFLFWINSDQGIANSLSIAVSVLVIACPCALGLATPIALMVASGKAAKMGIILRSPRAIEKAVGLTDAVFDKTGTITTAKMELLEMTLINNPLKNSNTEISTAELMSFAYSLESMDSHPIALAISSALAHQGISKLPVTEFEHKPGAGVTGRILAGNNNKGRAVLIGSPLSIAKSTTEFSPEIKSAINEAKTRSNSVSVIAVDGIAYGVFEVGDQLRDDGKLAITSLEKQGIKTWLLTGDSESSAINLGSKAGIELDHIFAQASPEDKLNFVTSLQSTGKVLMIGDGINDAAAMAKSDLSIAMGSGTDTAIATADITLIRPSLLAAIDAINICKKTVRVIKSNLGWAFFYNLAFIPVAASGNLSPMYAAAAMSLSSVFVVLNSLRIK
jgi:Cu+-exporting ATPase